MELNDLESKSLSDLACMIELAYVKNYSNEDIKAIKDAFLETCKIELSSALSDDDETVCELIREAIEQVLEAELE
ncbi:hypothetical protein [Thorsellia kenyensis]|uniref:Uncharacterized protein n=1 Tax=Thorsellia kenyensis TaxID=1549888 RepID=A0ABV6CBC9_9GAMM